MSICADFGDLRLLKMASFGQFPCKSGVSGQKAGRHKQPKKALE